MLDVPRELVAMLAGRLRTERRARGTRKGTRALSCWYQALLVLVWFRKREDLVVLAAGFGISRATAYRYRDEATTVPAEAAPDLHEALARVAEEGWSHVVLDGKLFRTDRAAATTTSVKGETINSWHSGKHHHSGGLVEAIMRPDGFRGRRRCHHDLRCRRACRGTSPLAPPASGRGPDGAHDRHGRRRHRPGRNRRLGAAGGRPVS